MLPVRVGRSRLVRDRAVSLHDSGGSRTTVRRVRGHGGTDLAPALPMSGSGQS